MSDQHDPSLPCAPVSVVIPVRDMEQLLGPCLASVVPQVEALGGELLVVDDGSTDRSADIASRAGAAVLRQAPAGPYVARNQGWRASRHPLVVFTDARCRPRPGWLSALAATLASDQTAAIAGGDVVAIPRPGLAARYASTAQPLLAHRSLGHEFLPYFAGANLATRRSVLEAVGGFAPIPSGGDLDLCWRVQRAHLGSLRFVPEATVDWEPRRSVREVVGQFRKYGAAQPELRARFAADGCPLRPPSRTPIGLGRGLAAGAPARLRTWGLRVEAVEWLVQAAYWRAYRAAYRSLEPTHGITEPAAR